MTNKFLIVALGNPGAKYADTRHNAGRWLLDKLVEAESLKLKRGLRVRGHFVKHKAPDSELIFYEPSGYMNTCGQPIGQALRYFSLDVPQLVVLHDDLDFAPGEVRFKVGGGHGGHNGLRDIFSKLGGRKDFLRVRVGIGHPGSEARVDNYVLTRPPTAERRLIDGILAQVLQHQEALLSGDFDALMQIFHS